MGGGSWWTEMGSAWGVSGCKGGEAIGRVVLIRALPACCSSCFDACCTAAAAS